MNSLFVSGLLLAAGIASVRAALIYDGFDYANGADLAAQTNPGGNAWAATGTSGTGGTDAILVTSGSLSVPGLAASVGNSITYGGLGLTDRLSVGSAITSGAVYYSFAVRVDDLSSLNTAGGFMAGFNTATGTQTAQPGQVGARLLTRSSGAGYNLGMERNSGTGANFVWDSAVQSVGDTIFVVGRYEFQAGASNDICTLWINPDASTFGAASAPAHTLSVTAINGTDLTQVASFLFRQGNAATVPDVVVADELRVDTSWAGVTPVPEPGGIALTALGAALLGWRRVRGQA